MIYITGDTHIPVDIGKLNTKNFKEQKQLCDNDYLIICGDFGGIWDDSNEEKYWLKWLQEKPFTTLFVDGNHENFTLLNSFPQTKFYGGIAHKINDKIFHLMRGQVYVIDNTKIFTFGGASSHDKDIRKEGINWWQEELPSKEELETATKNLDKHNWSVDYIISHCAPTSIQQKINKKYETNELTDFFEILKNKCSYKQWFFGHYHTDVDMDEKHKCFFNRIIHIV